MCISKWSRCICKLGSDWGADPIDITQPNIPSNNDKGDRCPLPLDWSDQENFWNGTDYEKIRPERLRPVQMPSPKRDSEESDWNENLYPHSY